MAFTVSTPTSAPAWRPDHYEFAPGDVLGDALIVSASTRAGTIEGDAPSVRVAFVDDAAAENVKEAQTFTEAQPSLSEALVWTTKTVEHLRISREQWTQPQTPEQLSASAARAVIRRVDQNFLTQVAPTAPDVAPVPGLLHWPGTVNGGAIGENLDDLVDLIAALEINLATPSHIVLGPLGWAEVRKWKTAVSYNSTLLGAGTTDAAPMVLSLPVVVNKAITDYSGLVIDRSAIVSAYGNVMVSTSMDRYHDSDSVSVNTIFRAGHTVPRPNRLGRFSIEPAGS